MSASPIEIIATSVFSLAIIHTFLSGQFRRLAAKFASGSIFKNTLHLLSEIEIIFGFWAVILLGLIAIVKGRHEAVSYVENLNFTEPLFVFAIMVVAATRPIIHFTRWMIIAFAKKIPINQDIAVFISCLTIGPLLGSFITEPAAMTVTAFILRDFFFTKNVSRKFKYAALGVLFVNVSIGGALTPFAAPPVLMVASKWGWDLPTMMQIFGWKSIVAVAINAIFAASVLRRELVSLRSKNTNDLPKSPAWIVGVHILFLVLIILNAHHIAAFMGLLFLFLGFVFGVRDHQDELLIKQSLFVALFLSGLVVIGGLQKWWLQPVLSTFSDFKLFLGATMLTAIADNAAITFLGSQLENVSRGFQYALVAGAITGGGLTVIANAPNPAGFAILQESFGEEGIQPASLFLAALVPTLITLAIFGYFWI